MRRLRIGLALLFAAVLTFGACGDPGGIGSSQAASSSSGPSAVDCKDIPYYLPGDCEDCIHERCCPELVAAANQPNALACAVYALLPVPKCEVPEVASVADTLHSCIYRKECTCRCTHLCDGGGGAGGGTSGGDAG